MYPAVTPPAVMSFCELKDKEVVNIRDGSVLGCVCDIEFRICDGQITAICVPGSGFFSSLSAKNRLVIPWCNIERIGTDTILVKYSEEGARK